MHQGMKRLLAIGLVLIASCHERGRTEVAMVPLRQPEEESHWSEPDPEPEPPQMPIDVKGFGPGEDPVITITSKRCETVFVVVTHGQVKIGDDLLGATDIAVFHRLRTVRAEPGDQGSGIIVRTALDERTCADWASAAPKIIRGASTPEVRWANGASAWLDVGPDVSKTTYIGRVAISTAMEEPAHADSWEALRGVVGNPIPIDAVDPDGELQPGEIKWVSPGRKYSWKPQPGTTLQQVQIFFPRGPEKQYQRLAARR